MDGSGYHNLGHRFDRFIDPARARPQVWRLLLGCVLALVVYGIVVSGIIALAWRFGGFNLDPGGLEALISGDTPASMAVVLATFAGMAIGPMVAVAALHTRSARTLFGPAATVLRDFVVAAGIMFGLLALSLVVWSFFYDALPNIDFSRWIVLLPLALLGVAIQTGAEEILFRGYLQQQLAARFASPLIWMILPAILFAFGHLDPTQSGLNTWLIVLAAGIFGLIAADLTYHSGSIGAAWGLHFANNTVALLIVGTSGTMTGLALYETPYDLSDTTAVATLIPIDIGILLLGWFLVRRFVRSR